MAEAARALMAESVELRGDERSRELVPEMGEATEEDWATEYLDLIMAVRVVPDIDAAIEHIRRYGTGHTEAIVTDDRVAADRFVAAIDTAVVAVNVSTRFTDGEEFGFGAEIGNSTQKLHVRGPMGLESLPASVTCSTARRPGAAECGNPGGRVVVVSVVVSTNSGLLKFLLSPRNSPGFTRNEDNHRDRRRIRHPRE